MKITFLGSGCAFTVGEHNYHSNLLLEAPNKKRLLIDCGSDIRYSLNDVHLSYKDINGVFISHLHADHVGGLEWLAFSTKFEPTCNKPVLYIAEALESAIWENVLKGGLSSIYNEETNLSSYFSVVTIPEEKNTFNWEDIAFKLVKTVHVISNKVLVPSYGLFFKINHTTIFFTSDTQFKPDIYKTYYEKADLIFHDCETKTPPSSVHSNYAELLSLDKDIRSKMWLYHYSDGGLPNALKDSFKGFVKKGQIFEF